MSQNPDPTTPPATGTPTTDPTPAPQSSSNERTFTQAELDQILSKRLDQQQKQIDAKLQAEREAAMQDRLKEQQEWKTLAEQHEDAVRTLTPELEGVKAERDALLAHLEADLAARMKEWPKELKDLVPSDGSMQARLDAFKKAGALVEKYVGPGRTAGNGPNPRPHGGSVETHMQQVESDLRKSGRYTRI